MEGLGLNHVTRTSVLKIATTAEATIYVWAVSRSRVDSLTTTMAYTSAMTATRSSAAPPQARRGIDEVPLELFSKRGMPEFLDHTNLRFPAECAPPRNRPNDRREGALPC